MDNIKDVVKNVINDLAHKGKKDYEDLAEVWGQALAKKTQSHAKFMGVKEGIVLIYVDSPAALFQIRGQKKMLLTKFKEKYESIKDISFKIGSLR